jgi:hypothetical protein
VEQTKVFSVQEEQTSEHGIRGGLGASCSPGARRGRGGGEARQVGLMPWFRVLMSWSGLWHAPLARRSGVGVGGRGIISARRWRGSIGGGGGGGGAMRSSSLASVCLRSTSSAASWASSHPAVGRGRGERRRGATRLRGLQRRGAPHSPGLWTMLWSA